LVFINLFPQYLAELPSYLLGFAPANMKEVKAAAAVDAVD
jgi:hypothetical protein